MQRADMIPDSFYPLRRVCAYDLVATHGVRAHTNKGQSPRLIRGYLYANCLGPVGCTRASCTNHESLVDLNKLSDLSICI
jgi:hypothetical protein